MAERKKRHIFVNRWIHWNSMERSKKGESEAKQNTQHTQIQTHEQQQKHTESGSDSNDALLLLLSFPPNPLFAIHFIPTYGHSARVWMMPIIGILLKCQRCYGLQRLNYDNDNSDGSPLCIIWKRTYGIGEHVERERAPRRSERENEAENEEEWCKNLKINSISWKFAWAHNTPSWTWIQASFFSLHTHSMHAFE